MRRRTQAVVLVVLGILLLALAAGDLMVRLVLPSFRVPLLLAGATLVTLGVATLVVAVRDRSGGAGNDDHDDDDHDDDHDDDDHGHAPGEVPRIGLVLLAPVVAVLAFGVQPLGAPTTRVGNGSVVEAAAPRTTRTTDVRPVEVDLDSPVVDTTIGGLLALAATDPGSPELRRRMRVLGYVEAAGEGRVTVSRYSMTCCVADAKVLSLDVATDEEVAVGMWVEVVGSYVAPPPGSNPMRLDTRHGLAATEPLRVVSAPSDPYEHP